MEVNKLIELEKYCEENFTCPYCKDGYLVGTSFEDIILMCDHCGSYFGYDEKNNNIYDLKEEKKTSY